MRVGLIATLLQFINLVLQVKKFFGSMVLEHKLPPYKALLCKGEKKEGKSVILCYIT